MQIIKIYNRWYGILEFNVPLDPETGFKYNRTHNIAAIQNATANQIKHVPV